MRLAPLVAAALLPLPALAGKGPAPSVDGIWDTPGGRLELKTQKAKVVGTLLAPAEGSELAAGTKVLEGSFYEDNLAADVVAGVVETGCSAKKEKGKAYVMLLLTKKGKLTGGVSSKLACAQAVTSTTWQRAASAAAEKPKTMRGEQAPEGTYDPRGHRTAPIAEGTAQLMEQATALMGEGRFEQARKLFQEVTKKDPRVGEAYNGVGVTYYARNAFDDAIDWYKRGLEAAPGFGDLYYNLACAYAVTGKKTHALRYLKLAATKGYTELAALDEDHDLDSLREEPEFKAIRELMEAPPAPPPP